MNTKSTLVMAIGIGTLWLLVSCSGAVAPQSEVSPGVESAFDLEAWRTSVFETWAEQDGEFKNSATSPLAGVSRFEIKETATVYFAVTDAKLAWSIDPGDSSKFSVVQIDEGWKWTGLSDDVACTREGENPTSGSLLQNGDVLKTGQFSVEFYPVEDQLIVLVFDAGSRLVKDFTTVERFEPDARFTVTATIVKFESPQQVELMTARQKIKSRFRYAMLKFEIDGVELELTAFKYSLDGEYSDVLFMPFTDKTTGKQTYGGGRYLSAEEPNTGDKVEIDFNLVTNPLCSYAPIYNCIVPPRENKLPIEVLAGEKKFK